MNRPRHRGLWEFPGGKVEEGEHCRILTGEPRPIGAWELARVAAGELLSYPMPEADVPVARLGYGEDAPIRRSQEHPAWSPAVVFVRVLRVRPRNREERGSFELLHRVPGIRTAISPIAPAVSSRPFSAAERLTGAKPGTISAARQKLAQVQMVATRNLRATAVSFLTLSKPAT